ncbi:uncharacterized protein LOC123009456 isoform X2 [Tribolium madens]|uniref:uncharacterized protein LOC123009456 isoform X2 n=1 Tax=Tribolium madens TaxID=41895 RepID=UPI001CF73BEB|nr:uncharacterized protein LOC123009456 isoform X2 [Tribolium madens]
MENKIGCNNNSVFFKNNQSKIRIRYSKYLSKNKPTKIDFAKVIMELEQENAEMEKAINLLEFKNKILEENCHFLKDKNYYIERKLYEIEISERGVQKEEDSNETNDETEQKTDKFTYLKERISGAIFGFVVPNLSKICHKIKEKQNEIKELIEEGGVPKCPIKKLKFEQKIATIKVNIYRVVIVFGTLMVLSGVGYAGYKIWKNRFRHPAYLVPSEDDDDESGDEIFRAPGTSRGVENAAMPKTNSSESFSTDFKSILDTANKK